MTGPFAARFWARRVEAVLLFLLFAGPPALRERNPMASLEGRIDFSVAFRVIVWILAGAWVLWNLLGRDGRHGTLTLRLPVPPIAIVCGLGVAWFLAASSVRSPSPSLTLFGAYQFGVGVLAAWLMARKLGTTRVLEFLRTSLAILCYAIYIAALIRPDLVESPEALFGLRGDAVAPAAIVGLLLFVLVLVWPFPARAEGLRSLTTPKGCMRAILELPLRNRLVLLVLSLSLLILARRRVGIAMLILVLALALVIQARKWSPSTLAVIGLLLVAGLITSAYAYQESISWVLRNPRQMTNLSGRVPLWSALAEQTLTETPLLGLGYWAGTRVESLEVNPALGNAHSTYVEILSGGGVPAFLLYVAAWGVILAQAAVLTLRGSVAGIAMALLAVAVAGYATMTSHAAFAGPPFFLTWLLAALSAATLRAPIHSESAR